MYPELIENKENIISTIIEEKDKFVKTLENGERELQKELNRLKEKNIDKEELLKLMNISHIRESIEIEKIETPKIYNNIFYRVYFIVDTTDDVINDSMNELQSNLHLLFERKGFIDRKTEYCCTISNYDNRIYFLDRMRHKYKQVERY